MHDFFHNYDPIFFVSHIDGDCVNSKEGRLADDVLYVTTRVKASDNSSVFINGKEAEYDADTRTFYSEVALYNYRNTICAIDKNNGYRAEIVIYWLRDAVDKFYFTVDDVIVCLYELTKDPERYPSLFDHPFLALFKEAHRLYGANVHLNLYYSFDEASAKDFNAHKEYFDLSMMTDRYKSEWEANAHWLTLSYHAYANYPDMPHKYQSAEFIADSIRRTHKEIARFAGKRSVGAVTTEHWGNGYIEQHRVFRESGYVIECGSFRSVNKDEAYLSYFGRDGLSAYLRGTGRNSFTGVEAIDRSEGRDVWKNNAEDTYYCHTDMVLNNTKGIPTDQIESLIDKCIETHPSSGIMMLMIHEEYFYEDYIRYIPDFAHRVLKAIKYVYDKGYRSCPLEDIILERRYD